MTDAMSWCDEYLPDLYDLGMFDEEDTYDAVWEAFESIVTDTILDLLDDPAARDLLHDQLLDAAQEWFRAHHDILIDSLSPAPPTALLSRPQTNQHSADWYAQRAHRLTASEFSQVLDGRRNALLRSKVLIPEIDDSGNASTTTPTQKAPISIAQPDGEMTATLWGHRFESITRAIYEQELAGPGTVNDTLGRFQHQIVPWLSASPDGVVVSGARAGRLVEIKSPKSRQPGEFVPSDYYAQMQVQMEVCDAEAVDFVEAQFAQRPIFHHMMGGWTALAEDDEIAIKNAAWKGRIQVYGHAEAPSTWTYRYTQPVEELDDTIRTNAYLTPAPTGLPLLEESIWWLTGFFPRTVLRNPVWWDETGWPAASMFWAEVESLRANPSALPPAVTRSTTVTVFKDDSPSLTTGHAFSFSTGEVAAVLQPLGGCGFDTSESDDVITLVGGGGWMGRSL